MKNRDVPRLLLEMYEEALSEYNGKGNERYRLALLGLVNAFESDLETMGITLEGLGMEQCQKASCQSPFQRRSRR